MRRTSKSVILSLMVVLLLSLKLDAVTKKTVKLVEPAKSSSSTIKPLPTIKSPTLTVEKWQVPAAAYCLSITSTKPELPGYIDLNRYCLPGDVTNGIDIRSATGEKLLFKLLPNHNVIIDSAPQAAHRQIYFGFDKPLPEVQSDKKTLPDGTRLKLTVINRHLNYLSGDEWIKDQQQRIIKKNERRKKYYQKSLDEYLERGIMPRINFAISQCFWWDSQLAEQLLAVDTYQQYYLDWRPPSKKFIDLRTLHRYNRLLYNSLYAYIGDVSRRVRVLRGQPEAQKKQLAKLPKQVKNAPKKAFIKLFDTKQRRWKRMIRGTKAVTEINLERRPFDSRRNFGAIFSGKLIIPQTGEYQFAINSTSSTMLQIDKKNIFTWLGAHNPEIGWGKTIKHTLKAGLHDFKLYYHKASGFTHATVAWQPPGTTKFSIMNENNFAPGWINQPLKCSATDGTKYPIIKRTARQLLFIGKRQRAILTNFKILSGNAQNYTWQFAAPALDTAKKQPENEINHHGQFNNNEIDIIFSSEGNEKITVTDTTNKTSSLQLHPMPNTDKLNSINPDLQLKLWLPTFIYDDELLHGQIEISSNLQEKINCILKIKASRENSILPNSVKRLVIPAKPLDKQAKFASNSMIKNNLKLNGAKLTEPLNIKLSLEVPGMVFDQQQLRFILLQALPELRFNGEYLTDQAGIRVIPVLHRPTLSELRTWELPVIIQYQLHDIKTITLIADDFGAENDLFVSAMKNRLAKHNIKLNFNAWRKQSNGFAMLSSLPEILPESSKLNSDTVVIIPPATDFNGIASARLQGRTIAALLEQLQHNPNIRNIYLTTPFPSPTAHHEHESKFKQLLQKLCRAYNIEFIDLNSHVKNFENWKSGYRITPDNPTIIAPYPIQLIEECSDFLIKKMVK